MTGWLAPLAEAIKAAEQREKRNAMYKDYHERKRLERVNAAAHMRSHRKKKAPAGI